MSDYGRFVVSLTFRVLFVAAVIIAMVALINLAQAQTVAGGGGGEGFGNFVRWLIGPIGLPTVAVCGALIAIGWMAGRRDVDRLIDFALGATMFAGCFIMAAFFITGSGF